jgi:hypothetical protein
MGIAKIVGHQGLRLSVGSASDAAAATPTAADDTASEATARCVAPASAAVIA